MRSAWALVGAAGLACALAAEIDLHGEALASGASLAGALLAATLAPGSVAAATDAASLGERGALALEVARPMLPLLASGLLLTFVFGARAMRARSWRELGLHLGLAFVSGAAASWVVRADDRAEVALWLAAVTIAALLSSVPWLVPTDPPRVVALRRLASRARGSLRARLLRAAAVARRLSRAGSLARADEAIVQRTFQQVLAIAERRVDGRGSLAIEDELSRCIERLAEIARRTGARQIPARSR